MNYLINVHDIYIYSTTWYIYTHDLSRSLHSISPHRVMHLFTHPHTQLRLRFVATTSLTLHCNNSAYASLPPTPWLRYATSLRSCQPKKTQQSLSESWNCFTPTRTTLVSKSRSSLGDCLLYRSMPFEPITSHTTCIFTRDTQHNQLNLSWQLLATIYSS